MIFDQVTLHNFGVFAGKQEIPLRPKSKSKPVILIGAMNGSGKTTFLDAIHLAFFGKRAKCSNRGVIPYEEFLKRCIHRNATEQEGASIQIDFTRVTGGREERFTLLRTWSAKRTRVNETVEVLREDTLDRDLTENWDSHVDGFMPYGIAPLFFFDGEKIEALADIEKSAQMLSTAIHNLLGIDLIEQLATDLDVLKRRQQQHLKEGRPRDESEALDKAYQEALGMQREIGEQYLCAKQEVEFVKKDLLMAERALQTAGGDLFANRKEMEDEYKRLSCELHSIEESLRELAAGPLPLLLAWNQLMDIESKGKKSAEYRVNGVVLASLENRDNALLSMLKRKKAAKKTIKDVKTYLRNDTERRKLEAQSQGEDDVPKAIVDQITILRTHIKKKLQSDLQRVLSEMEEKRDQLTRLESDLSKVPEEEEIGKLIKAVDESKSRLAKAEAKMELLGESHDKSERRVASAKSALESHLAKVSAEDYEQEAAQRVLKYSSKVQEVLRHFLPQLRIRHSARIADEVSGCLKMLIRKQHLIHSVSIEPDTLKLRLKNRKDQDISADRLSAGERQLLAVAILWGMAKASERPLPKIIDTPLGRLDSTHRSNLVENYFPKASHQVILLSTDEEIDKRYLSMMDKYISHRYRFEYDQEQEFSVVQEGYFC